LIAWNPDPTPAKTLEPLISQLTNLAKQKGYDPAFLLAQAWQESHFDPTAASPVGAKGLFQFMPATAAEYQVDVDDVESSAIGAMRYMGTLLAHYKNDRAKALAAYNWGQGHLDELLKQHPSDWKQYIPRETYDYLRILDLTSLIRHFL